MTKQVEKRLTDLEHSTIPDRGHVVLWSDQAGVYYDQPLSDPDRRRISEDDRRALELRHDLIIVEYVKRSEPA